MTPSNAADLTFQTLEKIQQRFALVEHGEPFMILPSETTPEMIGALRVFSGEKLTKLVHLEIAAPTVRLNSRMIFAFADSMTAIPHFTLGSILNGENFKFQLDLIPRVDLGANLDYIDFCFQPLTEEFEAFGKSAGLSRTQLNPRQNAMMSPWMLAYRADEAAFERVETAVSRYLEHWFDLIENDLPKKITDRFSAADLYERDKQSRTAIFNPEVNRIWSQIDRLVGGGTGAKMREILQSPRVNDGANEIKRIAIFGATGGTGRELVRQALADNYEVTVFARNPAKLGDLNNKKLRVVAGDVVNFEAVEKAVVGQDAVLSALGSPTLKKNRVLSDGTKNIMTAMEKHAVKRFVCETSLGVGDSKGQPGFIFSSLVAPLFLRHAFADKEIQERDIRRSNLDWVIVRPGALTNGAATGNYRYGLNRSIKGKISRADVAEFMLKQLKTDEYLRQTPAICY